MTNEELKKKIVEIVLDTEITGIQIRAITGGYSMANSIADALIAAGIGDVSELKKHRVVVEKSLIPEDDNVYVLPNIPPEVKQLYSGEEVEQIVKERDEYKHRAQVAERALMDMCEEYENYFECDLYKECNSDKPCYLCDYTERLQRAERKLAEEGKE